MKALGAMFLSVFIFTVANAGEIASPYSVELGKLDTNESIFPYRINGLEYKVAVKDLFIIPQNDFYNFHNSELNSDVEEELNRIILEANEELSIAQIQGRAVSINYENLVIDENSFKLSNINKRALRIKRLVDKLNTSINGLLNSEEKNALACQGVLKDKNLVPKGATYSACRSLYRTVENIYGKFIDWAPSRRRTRQGIAGTIKSLIREHKDKGEIKPKNLSIVNLYQRLHNEGSLSKAKKCLTAFSINFACGKVRVSLEDFSKEILLEVDQLVKNISSASEKMKKITDNISEDERKLFEKVNIAGGEINSHLIIISDKFRGILKKDYQEAINEQIFNHLSLKSGSDVIKMGAYIRLTEINQAIMGRNSNSDKESPVGTKKVDEVQAVVPN